MTDDTATENTATEDTVTASRGRALLFGFAVVIWAMPACSGRSGDVCSDHGDCAESLYCAGPDDPNVCGIPPMQQCAGDQDCDPSMRCFAVPDACSPDGVGSECRTPCNTGGCFPGFYCNGNQACVPIACDEGATCAPYRICDPSIAHGDGPVYDRTDGCVAVTCQSDADCPTDTACVNGACHSGPGTCREVQLVP